jgi:uncharacterized protein with PQ loop repeat
VTASSLASGVFSVPNLVGYAASLITGGQVVRQLVDAWRVPDPFGVSWLTWDLALIQSFGLLVLSVSRGYAAGALVNAFVGVISILIIARTLGTKRSSPLLWPALTVGATITGCGTWLLVLGPTLTGTLGSVASAFVWVPQAVLAVRFRSPVGLSWAFIAAGLASSALWLTYAALISQWRFAVPPSSAIASLIVTAVFALWTRTRKDQGTPQAAPGGSCRR